jgi:hypothetical protein
MARATAAQEIALMKQRMDSMEEKLEVLHLLHRHKQIRI